MKKYIKICLLVLFVLILPTKKVFAMDTEDNSSENSIRLVKNDLRFPSFYSKQNQKFTREGAASLIVKGRNIINSLSQQEKPEDIFKKQTFDVFQNRSEFYQTFDSITNVTIGEWDTDEASRIRQTHLEAVIAVSWAIAFTPWVKGEEADRGSFSIKDDDEALNKFLGYYVVEAANLQSGNIKDLTFLYSGNFAYDRSGLSSHYTGHTIRQTGIDARFSKGGYPLTVLPFENTHILFGRVHTRGGEDKTFFKLEGAGLGDMYSTLMHSTSFSAPEPENPELVRREKDLLFHIKQSFETCVNDLGCDEKTRQIIHAYEELKKTSTTPKKEGETTYLGINEMIYAIQSLSQAKKQQEQKWEEFSKTLKSCGYSIDNLDYRTGNEFVISLQDIVNPPRNPVLDEQEKAQEEAKAQAYKRSKARVQNKHPMF